MSEYALGAAVAVGKDNLRTAYIEADGSPSNLHRIGTPPTPEEFFSKPARHFLDAAYLGAEWGVLGNPGPVSVRVDADDHVSQHMRVTNIPALELGFDPVQEMIDAEPAFADLLDSGFTFLTVNDGDIAAFAAAKLYGESTGRRFKRIANLISGGGVGGAIVERDERFPNSDIWTSDKGLWEVGHIPLDPAHPKQTIEKYGSGTAVKELTGTKAEYVDRYHPVWQEVGQALGTAVMHLAINGGAELVVISGSNGIHGYYHGSMVRTINNYRREQNPMADKTPTVIRVPRRPRSLTHTFELHGAQGAMISHKANRAADRIVRRQLDLDRPGSVPVALLEQLLVAT